MKIKLSEIVTAIKEEVYSVIREQEYESLANEFAKILQSRVEKYYKDSVDDVNRKNTTGTQVPYTVHEPHWQVKVKPGKRWIKIDVGTSGKFMLDGMSGDLYFIKGYGTPDLKKNFGNIQGIINNQNNWHYDGYSIAPIGKWTKYGYAGRID